MNFLSFLQKIGLVRAAVTAGMILSLGYFMTYFADHISKPDMVLLYGDLDPGEAGRIVTRLEEQQIPHQIKGGGTQIMVPIDRVARIRMDMAEAGLPNGGTVGYEIFDKSDIFGTSFFVQNLNQVRALEGELSRSIRTINGISAARVHLVLPKRELFNNEQQEPTASIVIRMQSAARLDDGKVRGVQYLVASAVPNLTPERVSVVDDRGNLLSASYGGGENATLAKGEEMRASTEARLESSIRSLLEKTLGLGKVRATVTVDMDFDRLTENSEIYDPEGQVQRSSQTIEDSSTASEEAAPTAGAAPAAAAGGNKNQTKRTEETINFEVSKTIKSHVKEGGSIKKLSIAVLVDGEHKAGANGGKETYTPRSKEDLAQIEKLVKSAVGFDEKRGDTLEVVNMPFSSDPMDAGPEVAPGLLGLEGHDIVRLIETAVLALLGLLLMLIVVKPLISRIISAVSEESETKEGDEGAQGQPNQMAAAPQGQAAAQPQAAAASAPMPGVQMGMPQAAPIPANMPAANNYEAMPNRRDQVEVDVKLSQGDRIAAIVDKHTEESVAMVKNWMNQ